MNTSDKNKLICCGCACFCCLSILVTVIVVVSSSFYRVDPLTIALKLDRYTKSVDKDNVYKSGLHYLGIGYEMIEFPIQVEKMIFSDIVIKESDYVSEHATIENTIKARTNTGLELSVDLYLAYRLTTSNEKEVQKVQLYDMFKRFGHNYEKFISFVVESEIRDFFAKKQAPDFWEERINLGVEMFQVLEQYLKEYHIKLEIANILNLNFSSKYEQVNLQTETVDQEIQQKVQYIKFVELQNEINTQKANHYSKQKEIQSDAQVKIIEEEYKQQKLAIVQQIDYEKKALKLIKDKFSEAKINEFLWIYMLKYKQSPNQVIQTFYPKGLQINA